MYATSTLVKKDTLDHWKNLQDKWHQELKEITDDRAGHISQPGKWSVKQILGHLCDSCWNNYGRVLEAQLSDGPYHVRKYGQEDWVRMANYQMRPWLSIVNQWHAQNQAMWELVANCPEEFWSKETIVDGETWSLGFLINDYVEHMRHHMRQIGL